MLHQNVTTNEFIMNCGYVEIKFTPMAITSTQIEKVT